MAAKKPAETTEIVPIESSTNVRTGLEFGPEDAALAADLGINLSASTNVRTDQAVAACNAATRHMVEAGLLLSSVKAEVDHDTFLQTLEERGMHKVRAYELIRGAALVARLPEAQRAHVLALSKSKVLALASSDPAVVEAMLADGDMNIDLLSVRALKAKLSSMEADLTDTQVQRDTLEAELEAARKRLNGQADRSDQVPVVVADLRAEIGAHAKRIELAVDSFGPMGQELAMLIGTEAGGMWVDATTRMALAALAAQRLQIDGQIKRWQSLLPEGERSHTDPDTASYLSPQEVLELAQAWQRITAVHEHEKALRAWEREQERPRGKGRPSAKPEAPKAAK